MQFKEAFYLMCYSNKSGTIIELVWNSRDGVTPFCIGSKDGTEELTHVQWEHDAFRPDHKLQVGDRYFADCDEEAATEAAECRLDACIGTDFELQGEERKAMIVEMIEGFMEPGSPHIYTKKEEG